MKKIIIGTRSSKLALWQADFIKSELIKLYPDIIIELKLIKTKGDKILDTALNKIGGKGLFTKELENELLEGTIDIAVHSLKDMPTILPDGLKLSAVTRRHSVEDVLIAKDSSATISKLKRNAIVATGSLRRKAQLLHHRPDFKITAVRGNVNTRLNKFVDSDWDAMVLARAGLERLRLDEHIANIISIEEMLPAVGQGALGIELANDNLHAIEIIKQLNDVATWRAVSAERAFLKALGGGCHTPIAAYAGFNDGMLTIDGLVSSIDGQKYYRRKITSENETPELLGEKLADMLIADGADGVLDKL